MKALSYFLIILLTPAIILLNFRYLVTNHDYYQQEFEKIGVYDNIERQTANQKGQNVIAYLGGKQDIDREFFQQREVQHMADIKKLIEGANLILILDLVLLVSITLLILKKGKVQTLLLAYTWASSAGLVTLAVLALISYLNFEALFINFHLISFDNDLWMLSKDSNLLKLFPQQFFIDFANRIAYQSLLMLGIIYLSAILLNRSAKNK